MVTVGQISEFKVTEIRETGFTITEIESGDEVYLPNLMAGKKREMDEELSAFIYLDSKGVKTASAELPAAVVGEYAMMQAIEVQEFGAFLDWGMDKDLLVPGNEQKFDIKQWEYYLVRVCLEEGTNRVYGTTKLGQWIEDSDFDILEEDKATIVPVIQTDLGYRCIMNKKFIAQIYNNEIHQEIEIGKPLEAIVKKIRLDGLVDAALQIQGIKNLDAATFKIIDFLKENGGSSTLSDKSKPEEIKAALGMSKQTFKRSIGMLYRYKRITVNKSGITITEKGQSAKD